MKREPQDTGGDHGQEMPLQCPGPCSVLPEHPPTACHSLPVEGKRLSGVSGSSALRPPQLEVETQPHALAGASTSPP